MLLTDRGPSGYLPDVWASLKASAAANPDVPTVLLLVALDVDALSSCAILMVRGLGPRAARAAASMPSQATLSPAHRHLRPSVLSDSLCFCPVQRLLEAEQIPHKVKPVSDYRNLGDIYVQHIANSTEARQTTPFPPHTRPVLGWIGWSQPGLANPHSVPHSARSCGASFCSIAAASSI